MAPFMKTRTTRSFRRLQLKITYFSSYTDQVYEMEKVLARKPEKLQIDIIGSGELSPDAALLMRSVLLKRSPQTQLITNARSSLQGCAVLVWLLGDTRLIREDAKLYFRRPYKQSEDEEKEDWKGNGSKDSDVDLEEVDYAQVLQHINNFLPVKELCGRPLDVEILRQFGLVDNEKADSFLKSAFARSNATAEPPGPALGKDRDQKATGPPCPEESNRSE
jgi:hypothetical protein